MTKDIVEFVEEICGVELLEPQKTMLRELHKRGPNQTLVMCKDHGKYDLRMLARIAKILVLGGDDDGSYSI